MVKPTRFLLLEMTSFWSDITSVTSREVFIAIEKRLMDSSWLYCFYPFGEINTMYRYLVHRELNDDIITVYVDICSLGLRSFAISKLN